MSNWHLASSCHVSIVKAKATWLSFLAPWCTSYWRLSSGCHPGHPGRHHWHLSEWQCHRVSPRGMPMSSCVNMYLYVFRWVTLESCMVLLQQPSHAVYSRQPGDGSCGCRKGWEPTYCFGNLYRYSPQHERKALNPKPALSIHTCSLAQMLSLASRPWCWISVFKWGPLCIHSTS